MTLVLHFTVHEHLPWHDTGVFPVHLTQVSEAVLQRPGSVLELYLVFQEDLTGQAGEALDVPPHSIRHMVQSKGCLQIGWEVAKLLCLHVRTIAINYFLGTYQNFGENAIHAVRITLTSCSVFFGICLNVLLENKNEASSWLRSARGSYIFGRVILSLSGPLVCLICL